MDPVPAGGDSSSSPKMERMQTKDLKADFKLDQTGLIIGVVVGLLTLLLIFVLRRKKSKGRLIAICGPTDAGKTALFGKLVTGGKFVDTYTSGTENVGAVQVPGGGRPAMPLVDIPGHERIRNRYLDNHKADVSGFVYVVDSSTIQKNLRDSTQFLFHILSLPTVHARRPDVLVACHKQDLPTAKGKQEESELRT